MKSNDQSKKRKRVYRIFVGFFALMTLILVCPPITKLFDRNDIWVGIFPLSQFYILLFTGLIVVALGILYLIDKKWEGGGKK